MIFQYKGQCITVFLKTGPLFLEQQSVPQESPEEPGKDEGLILGGMSYTARSDC